MQMIQKLMFIGLLASLCLVGCDNGTATNNGNNSGQDSVSVEEVGKLSDMVGTWAPVSFFENVEKTRSYTQNLNPKGIVIHEVGGKHLIAPFTVKSDMEMEINAKPEKTGYGFDGSKAGFDKDSHLKFKDGVLSLNGTEYKPFTSEEYILLGGEYQASGAEGPVTVTFKKDNQVEFDNYVSYDLMTDKQNDILIFSGLPLVASYETYIEAAVWYIMEPADNGYNLYEIKNYDKSSFDATQSSGGAIPTVAEKGELKYTLTKM